MNLLEIFILLFALWMAFWGFRKGFIKKLAPILALVLSIVLVSLTLPVVTELLRDYTPVYTWIVSQCEKVMDEKLLQAVDSEGQEMEYTDVYENMGRLEQIELIENLPLPDILKDQLLDYNNAEGYKSLAVSSFRAYVSHSISNIILNAAAFLAAVLAVQLLLWAILTALKVMAGLPVIRVVDRLAGLALGLVQALLFVWMFFMILSLVSGTDIGMYLTSMIQNSACLSELYGANLLLQIVLRTAAV